MPQRQIDQQKLNDLKTALTARWNAGLAAAPDDWKKIAKLVQSNGASNTYAWLSQFPAFREWVGARLHKKFSETAYMVVNRKFETTVDVPRTDIEDDNYGQYGATAEGVGHSATDLKNDLVYKALKAGFSTQCYDGQYFFDTDHPIAPNEDGSGTPISVSNMQAGTNAPWVLLCTKRAASPIYLQERMAAQFDSVISTQNPNVYDLDVYSFGGRWRGEAAYGFWQCAFGSKAALTPDNFSAAYDAMLKVSGDGNRVLGIVPDTLVVGPDNRAAAERLLKAQVHDGGGTNIDYNRVELIVTPWL